jgi:hypothetical protein
MHDRRLLIEPLVAAATVRGTGLLVAATTIRSGEKWCNLGGHRTK